MKANGGRLQTAEHILARTLERRFPDARFIIAKFEEDTGRMEIGTKEDLRLMNVADLQNEVNSVISRNCHVSKYTINRKDAERDFDLARLPPSLQEVRIVEIEGFDKTPCRDPHVENTGEIGKFTILKIERAGKDRYRFVFRVD